MIIMETEYSRLTYRFQENEWTVQQVGTDYEYQKLVTLTGAAQNIDLDVYFPVRVERIDYYSNDDTQKSFEIRVFDGAVNTASYSRLAGVTNDLNVSLMEDFEGQGFKFLQTPIRIRTAITASTVDKTLTIKIHIKRIDRVDILDTRRIVYSGGGLNG